MGLILLSRVIQASAIKCRKTFMIDMLSLRELKAKTAELGSFDWTSPPPPIESLWCFEMKASRLELWEYLSDTSRFNRELGLAPRQQVEKNGKALVKTTILGLPQEWIEDPWLWVFGQTFMVTRNYIRGIGKRVHAAFHIEEVPAAGVRRVYVYFGWHPANRFWGLFIRLANSQLKKKFQTVFDKIDKHLSAASPTGRENALQSPPHLMAKAEMSTLEGFRQKLHALKLSTPAVDQLCEHVTHADDLELESIRVRKLARDWALDYRELLSVCLHATKLGSLKSAGK